MRIKEEETLKAYLRLADAAALVVVSEAVLMAVSAKVVNCLEALLRESMAAVEAAMLDFSAAMATSAPAGAGIVNLSTLSANQFLFLATRPFNNAAELAPAAVGNFSQIFVARLTRCPTGS